MKAALLKEFGTPLAIEDLPDPVLGTGEVIVDVVAAPVLSYAGELFAGRRNVLLDLPQVPGVGAIGRVRAVGPDATRLMPGDWVFCDPTVRSRDPAPASDMMLQGWAARGDGGLRLQKHFRHGSLAQQMRVPTENAIAIGPLAPDLAGAWCALATTTLVPYGGLLAAGFQAGETLLVSGATGNFGSAGVAVALAMGAGLVVAPGRNQTVLAELARRFGPRVRPVTLTGDVELDRRRMVEAAAGPIDCVLDLLPPTAPVSAVRAAVLTVRPHGRVVLMGGVGGLGGAGLDLPYPWIMRNCVTIHGQWMYPPTAVARLAALVRAGLLRFDLIEVTEFGLDQINAAVAHAAAAAGPFRMTVIRP